MLFINGAFGKAQFHYEAIPNYGQHMQEVMMSMSMRDTLASGGHSKDQINAMVKSALKKPNAAVGQSGLQALYETMFRNYGLLVGQVHKTSIVFRRSIQFSGN